MKKILALSIVLCVVFIFSVESLAGGISAEADSVEVSARSAVLLEISGGNIIYEKNAYERLPMASTTKIMTALIALENCDISKIVSVSEEAVGIEGSSVYLYPDEKVRMSDLIYALMLESANDAATAIAIDVAGSVDAFAELMNNKAVEIGLSDTHFTNPHGLDDDDHYTTAYDLAKLAAYALENDSFRNIVSTYKRVIPLLETEGTRLLLNHNKLLKQYDGAIGVKTGFTKRSGRCLVSCAERDGLSLVAVTLNAPDDWNDHKKMLDLGFVLYEKLEVSAAGAESYELPCTGGTAGTVRVTNTSAFSAVVKKNEHNITKVVELKRFCYAPVFSGETVGRVCYYDNGSFIGQVELKAENDISAIPKKSFWDWILSLFN